MNPIDVAWLAGLIEGEGTFETTNKHQKLPCVRIAVKMTDLDVLEKAHRLFGGTIIGPELRNRKKPAWTWRLAKNREVLQVLDAIHPHMAQRRSRKIEEVAVILREKLAPKVCPECGGEFEQSHHNQKYCDHCRLKKSGSFRARQAQIRRAA